MKLTNENIYYINCFLSSCYFPIVIWCFFFTNYLNYSLWIATLINVIVWVWVLIFEIPSWAFADRFGRKKVYILGLLLLIIGLSIYLVSNMLVLLLLASIIIWAWFALISWSIEALIYDSLNESEENIAKRFKFITANGYIFTFLWRSVSAIWAWYLFLMNPLYPYISSIILLSIALVLSFFLKESPYNKGVETSNILKIKNTFHYLLRKRPVLIFSIYVFIFNGIGNIYWFLFQPIFKSVWFSIEHIGWIYCIIALFSALGAHLIKKIQDHIPPYNIMRYLLWVLCIISFMFISFSNSFIILPVVFLAFCFGFILPLWNNYISHNVPSEYRATALSIYSLLLSLSYFIFSWPIWFFVDIYWMEMTLKWITLIIITLTLFDIFITQLNKIKWSR